MSHSFWIEGKQGSKRCKTQCRKQLKDSPEVLVESAQEEQKKAANGAKTQAAEVKKSKFNWKIYSRSGEEALLV